MAEETTVTTTTEPNPNAAQPTQTTTPASTVTPPATPPTASVPESNPGMRMFTQEQLDAIISRERNKAIKGMFTAEQMAAKDSSISTLTAERDTANANAARLQEKLDEYEHERLLTSKGIPADMVEFYAFKIGKLVSKDKTFEQAAEEYIKDNPPAGTVRMSTGGGVGKGGRKTDPSSNDVMNNLIRGKT